MSEVLAGLFGIWLFLSIFILPGTRHDEQMEELKKIRDLLERLTTKP